MVAFASRTQRVNEIRPSPIGVFEDDSVLLRLAARSHFADFACPRAASSPINSDDVALEVARLADAEAWQI